MKVKISKTETAHVPTYGTSGAACFDFYADMPAFKDVPLYVDEGFPVVVSTGIKMEVPDGHVLLVFSRSGHGFKYDVRLANCVGVIDSDYRGTIMVKLTADAAGSFEALELKHHSRIAQGMIIPYEQVEFEEAVLSTTTRGAGGFGSTGA